MAEVHSLKRRRRAFAIPGDAAAFLSAFGSAQPGTLYGVKFRLTHVGKGTEIFFIAGGFSWNISLMLDVWPPSFAAAREWVAAYAAGHGQEIEECRRPRTPIATGSDRKVARAGGCKEAWLKSDVPSLWAEAMVRCQHPAGFCGQDGFCHYGNCDMEMEPAPSRP